MGGFLYWWQHLPENMSPEIFSWGALRVQWYGLMYIVAFALTYLLANRRIKTEARFSMYDSEFLKNILTWAFIGVLAGGRLGYVIFYNFNHYLHNPLEIILPFSLKDGHFTGISGMSYHGGVTGAILGPALFCRKYKADFWNLCDLFFPVAPLGYMFGRIGNFINGELYGRVTTSAIGMHFPGSPDPTQLRHPSQLYEAFFEGIFLFAVLMLLRKAKLPKGAMAGLYIFGYGFVRFFIEYYRQPDAHLGFVFLHFSMGQLLCMGMMAIGVGAFLWRRHVESAAVKT
jgi:phosphatidylglycerol---prolipoprotein diacylglyceryl transferase